MPDIDWDEVERAAAILEDANLRDVRAQKHGVHTATIDFEHPEVVPWMTNEYAFGSTMEVNVAGKVVDYTFRFPAILDMPNAPAPDAIEVALVRGADPLPPGRRVEALDRMNRPASGIPVYAPHIRGDPTELVDVVRFARMVPTVQERFYEAVID